MGSVYEWTLPSDATLSLQEPMLIRASTTTTPLNETYDKMPERHSVDMSLIWRSADKKLARDLFVDNVTDETMYRELGQANHNDNFRLLGTLLERTLASILMREFGG